MKGNRLVKMATENVTGSNHQKAKSSAAVVVTAKAKAAATAKAKAAATAKAKAAATATKVVINSNKLNNQLKKLSSYL
jgi:hypothetical protein